ncbi:hypothetical protein ORIO_00525 [Cereibacter azotoformans]|uniref:Uncharacterized protein n=1 Tax=Cereibacter sphaeroides (strain ATCC 17025 / ATH 2.4.3) TaxID=349102 RepID=A4WNP8_CERS5|nr:hypothetical protein [Cereibacter azotoformans]ULB08426.1 hypothetical protein ORIO_00525 [Cereibacter azotoformans]
MPRARKPRADAPPLPADAVRLAEAAEVVSLGTERLRQLAREGRFPIDRGQVSLTAAIGGVVAALRERATKGAKTASLSRAQDARAELLAARTERRRAQLVARADADEALDELGRRAVAALRRVPAERVAGALRTAVLAEIRAAERKINAAVRKAKRALATGDLSEIAPDE